MTISTDRAPLSFPIGDRTVKKSNSMPPMAQQPASITAHHQMLGAGAHAAMKSLSTSGMQSASVDPMRTFAELQDEGPTARAPRQG
jgi:hypothetical protein